MNKPKLTIRTRVVHDITIEGPPSSDGSDVYATRYLRHEVLSTPQMLDVLNMLGVEYDQVVKAEHPRFEIDFEKEDAAEVVPPKPLAEAIAMADPDDLIKALMNAHSGEIIFGMDEAHLRRMATFIMPGGIRVSCPLPSGMEPSSIHRSGTG